MGISWAFHGHFMGISWAFHGHFMGILWVFHGTYSSAHSADFCLSKTKILTLVFRGQADLPSAVPKDEDFFGSKTVFEIQHLLFQRTSLKNKNIFHWVPRTADFYVLEIPESKQSSSLKDRNLPCAVG